MLAESGYTSVPTSFNNYVVDSSKGYYNRSETVFLKPRKDLDFSPKEIEDEDLEDILLWN